MVEQILRAIAVGNERRRNFRDKILQPRILDRRQKSLRVDLRNEVRTSVHI